MNGLGEFDFIAQYFAPLAAGYEGAFGLTDDAAQLAAGVDFVVSTDTLIQGVHFRKADPWDLAIKKALRVNLSDLAAMGAQPHAVMLSLVWPEKADRRAMVALADGLMADLEHFRVPLIGGDTTRGGDRLVLSMTAFGECHQPLRRATASPGDDVYVSGTIGDAGLGLNAKRLHALSDEQKQALEQRYLLPEPRHELARALAEQVSAAIDVSDGLVADAGHIAAASGLGIELSLVDLPLSDSAKAWLNAEEKPIDAFVTLATRGDDYELLFCADPSHRETVAQAAAAAGIPVKRIGSCHAGRGVALLDASGEPVQISQAGFTHF